VIFTDTCAQKGSHLRYLGYMVNGFDPECRFHLELQEEERKCMEFLYKQQTDELIGKEHGRILIFYLNVSP
ncbi:hypothetical protein FKM82_007171, partial [Ascaphus truei]